MDKKDVTKYYSHGDLKIKWQPGKCIHSTNCWKAPMGLPEVFNPKIRPWIQPENADAERIKKHIDNCPSAALSYDTTPKLAANVAAVHVNFIENGPIHIAGPVHCTTVPLGQAADVFLCRCGGSKNKPFCDGSHATNGFEA
jgi:uncharacterized Fe-S cluster protein YjdI